MRDLASFLLLFFFFNDTATTEIYTLSLHDALPISHRPPTRCFCCAASAFHPIVRSEEHTSELQSHSDLVCRLLLEKKKTQKLLEQQDIRLLHQHTRKHHTMLL